MKSPRHGLICYPDYWQSPRRNHGVECRAIARSGVGHCPETPHNWECGYVPKLPKGYGPELSSHVESGELAEGERPGAQVAIAKSARHFIHPIRQDDVAPILRTEDGAVWAGTLIFMGATHKSQSEKKRLEKKAMGFAGGGAGSHDSGVRRMDDYRGTYETVVLIEKPVRRPAFDFT